MERLGDRLAEIKSLRIGQRFVRSWVICSITGGSNALAEVIVGVSQGGRTVTARGARDDIVMASVEAYISALNRLLQK